MLLVTGRQDPDLECMHSRIFCRTGLAAVLYSISGHRTEYVRPEFPGGGGMGAGQGSLVPETTTRPSRAARDTNVKTAWPSLVSRLSHNKFANQTGGEPHPCTSADEGRERERGRG